MPILEQDALLSGKIPKPKIVDVTQRLGDALRATGSITMREIAHTVLCDPGFRLAYFKMQIAAGVDGIQIFDSWGGVLAGQDSEAASLQWIRYIVRAMPLGFPIILYAKGTTGHLTNQSRCGVKAISVDWTSDISDVRRALPVHVALQGYLDPGLLQTTPEIVRHETTRLLEYMRGTSGHIFNLGLGISPDAKLDCVDALAETITQFR